jgi:hypothetical protein
LLKQIIEMRDQDGLVTYTYTVPETTGRPVFLCNSIGYGLPAATQYTNPEKYEYTGTTLPQADPNGLFSPDSAEGTWVMCSDPSGSGKTRPLFSIATGNSIVPSKQSCIAAGGKWSEGIQYGRITQLCTYN